jgi:hypothetical protein
MRFLLFFPETRERFTEEIVAIGLKMRALATGLAFLGLIFVAPPKADAQGTTYSVKISSISECTGPQVPVPNVLLTFQQETLSGPNGTYATTGAFHTVTTDSTGTATINLPQGTWITGFAADDIYKDDWLASSAPEASTDPNLVTFGGRFTLTGSIDLTLLWNGECPVPSMGPTSTEQTQAQVQISTVQSCTANDAVAPAPGIAVEVGNQAVTTDANGNATLNLPAAGSYPVFASYPPDVQSMTLAFVDLLPQNLRYKPAGESPLSIPLNGANEKLVIRLFNCDTNGQRTPRARVDAIGGTIRVTRSHAAGNAYVGLVLRDGDDVIVTGTGSITWLAGGTVSFQDSRSVSHFVIGPQAPAGTSPRPTVSGINILKGTINFFFPPEETKVNKFDASSGSVCVAIKGTQWAMTVDDQTQTTTVQVMQGTVDITPANLSLREFYLSAGQKVQVSKNGVGAITAIAAPGTGVPTNPAAPSNVPPAWVSGGVTQPAAPNHSPYGAPPVSNAPPSWISPSAPQVASGIAGAWQLTSSCGNWGFPAEGSNWHATIFLNETTTGALSGSFQNDAISMQLLPAASGFNNDPNPMMNSRQSGNAVNLVFHPASWISTLQLTGMLNGSGITGRVHHYGSDDCAFAMIRASAPAPVSAPTNTTTPSPAPTRVLNLAGVWTDRNGAWVYQFTQNGANFHWERNPPESANGTVNGYQIVANWGSGSGTGRIELDPSGVAVRIVWSNGETFQRRGVR